jgi:hypothetical protein
LFDVARSWLINLLKGSIYTWDWLCDMFIGNFYDTYECPSLIEVLKTIMQKHAESLRDYEKHFCNTRNAIPYIQYIEIINTFCDLVSNIKTMKEIAMKKPTRWPICSQLWTHQSRLLKPGLDFLNLIARLHQKRSRTTGRST